MLTDTQLCAARKLDSPSLLEEGAEFTPLTSTLNSRNATDGLLDGDEPTVVLATTHEEALHESSALTRHGRCLQVERFPQLGAREANEWLARRGLAQRTRSELSLAELHALERDSGVRAPSRSQPMGFAQAAERPEPR